MSRERELAKLPRSNSGSPGEGPAKVALTRTTNQASSKSGVLGEDLDNFKLSVFQHAVATSPTELVVGLTFGLKLNNLNFSPVLVAAEKGRVGTVAYLLLCGHSYTEDTLWGKNLSPSMKSVFETYKANGALGLSVMFPELAKYASLNLASASLSKDDLGYDKDEVLLTKFQEQYQVSYPTAQIPEVQKKFQWYYEVNPYWWEPYDENVNIMLAKHEKQKQGEVTMAPNAIKEGQIHTINFTTREQFNVGTSSKRKITKIADTTSSILSALETSLKHFKRCSADTKIETYLADINADVKKEKMLSSVFEAICIKFNLNLVVWFYNPLKELKKHTFFSYEQAPKSLIPTLEFFFDGSFYYPILELAPRLTSELFKSTPQSTTYSLSWLEFATVLRDPHNKDITQHIPNFDISTINEQREFEGRRRTLLYIACRNGHPDVVASLVTIPGIILDGSQDVSSGSSPLHVASWWGHSAVIAILLFRGADPNKPPVNLSGENSRITKDPKLIHAVWYAYEKKQDLLKFVPPKLHSILAPVKPSVPVALSKTASVKVLDKVKKSAFPCIFEEICGMINLEVLPENWKTIILDFIKENKPESLNRCSLYLGKTPFYLACERGHIELVKFFLDINEIQKDDLQMVSLYNSRVANTPLHIVTYCGRIQILALLLLANIPQQKNRGESGAVGILPSVSPLNDTVDRKTENIIRAIWIMEKKQDLTHFLRLLSEQPLHYQPKQLSTEYTEEYDIPYTALTYLFYDMTPNGNKLLEFSNCCALDYIYKKFAFSNRSPDSVQLYTSPDWNVTTFPCKIEEGSITVENNGKSTKNLVANRSPMLFFRWKDGTIAAVPSKGNVLFAKNQGKGTMKWESSGVIHSIAKENNVWTFRKADHAFEMLTEAQLYSIKNWRPSLVNTDKEEVKFQVSDIEYKKVSHFFYLTVPKESQIIRITRLYYKKSSLIYESRINEMIERHFDEKNLWWKEQEFRKLLWHGTGSTDPETVCSTSWHLNYASASNLWGRGIYFASDAGYSADYAHTNKAGNKVMILADVLVGNPYVCPENSAIKRPPEPTFDSILGYRRYGNFGQMSANYVIYDNGRALPLYLIEWK